MKDKEKLSNRLSRNVFAITYGRRFFYETGSGSTRKCLVFWIGGREGIILLVIKWLKSFSSLIILLTGYFSSAFHSLSLTAVVFYPLRCLLAQEFSCSQG